MSTKPKTVRIILKPSVEDCAVNLNHRDIPSVLCATDDCTSLSGGESLGLVQSVTVHAGVGEFTTATINTYCTEAELEVLQENTEVRITVVNPSPERIMDWEKRFGDMITKRVLQALEEAKRQGGALGTRT